MIKSYDRQDNVYEIYTNGAADRGVAAAEYALEKLVAFAVKKEKV